MTPRPGLVVWMLLGSTAACETARESADDLAIARDLSAAADLSPPPDLAQSPDLKPSCDTDGGIPATLACAGLYADFDAKTLRADALPYAPGFELWSDGAKKRRYLSLPPGGKIDVTAMQDWIFPVGTKLWKEFSLTLSGVDRRIETRMFWKRGDGDWAGVVYRWNDAETEATRLENGEASVAGTAYEVPAENRCGSCHQARTDRAAGFEAVLLASPSATGLTWAQLQAQGLVTASNGNASVAASALQIPGNATEVAALGFLHANCGVLCHQLGGSGPFQMNIDVSTGAAPATVAMTKVFTTAIAINSDYKPPGAVLGDNYYRLQPLDLTRSTIRLRMNARDAPPGGNGIDQMPPLISHVVSAAGLAAIDAWIGSMTIANGYPPPGPN